MKKIVATTIRDLINLLLYAGVLIGIIFWIYNAQPDLVSLKNVLFPMNAAVLLCVFVAITFIFINRVSTFMIIRLMRR